MVVGGYRIGDERRFVCQENPTRKVSLPLGKCGKLLLLLVFSWQLFQLPSTELALGEK